MIVAMDSFEHMKTKFCNQRQWRDFVAAVQCSVNYPTVINALRSGTQWFTAGLVQPISLSSRR
jgi:hypothetical protein